MSTFKFYFTEERPSAIESISRLTLQRYTPTGCPAHTTEYEADYDEEKYGEPANCADDTGAFHTTKGTFQLDPTSNTLFHSTRTTINFIFTPTDGPVDTVQLPCRYLKLTYFQ